MNRKGFLTALLYLARPGFPDQLRIEGTQKGKKEGLGMSAMKKLTTIFVVAFALVLSSTQASAHWWRHHVHEWAYFPIALCQAGGTNVTLPPYVCCEKHARDGHHVWRDTWVAGKCTNADPRAVGDMGCTDKSPVYGTNGPIVAQCYFSHSTGKYY